MEPRPFHRSITILANTVVMLAFGLMTAADPITRILERNGIISSVDRQDVLEILQVISTVFGLGGSAGVFLGRVRVGDIYTPHWLPGPNESDCYGKFVDEVATSVRHQVPVETPIEEVPFHERF